MTDFENPPTRPDGMTNGAMLDAPTVLLGRAPSTPGAHALVGAVLDAIRPRLASDGARSIGGKSMAGWLSDVGNVLAGVMRPSERVVSVQRGKGIGVWAGGGNGIGHQRFWRIADAMASAGLFWEVKGTKTNTRREVNGYPTRIGPTARLLDLAGSHGVTTDTRKADWRLDTATLAASAPASHAGVLIEEWRAQAPLGVDEAERKAADRDLAALNALNAQCAIRGAGPTITLHRKFHVNMGFGGRHYGPAYLNVPVDERLGITMDGEAVAEVDLKAAQLSVAAGLAGMAGDYGQLPWMDPYGFPELPRAAVKAWTTRTIGRGGAALWRAQDRRWDAVDPPEVQFTPFGDVETAMVARFPFMADLRGLVPPGVLDVLPVSLRGKAAGLYVTAREARIVAGAMGHCVTRGVPVLPVHDALIVPASRVGVATEGLEGAGVVVAGVRVRWEVETV